MWSTRAGAVGALRTRMQDDAAPYRYSETELGLALDQAIDDLSAARPLMQTVHATTPADGKVRIDNLLSGVTFGALLAVIDTRGDMGTPLYGWSYYEAGGQHYALLPSAVAVGTPLALQVRGGYGFGFDVLGTLVDTNIPREWRGLVLQGAEAHALMLYGKREIRRANVAPAMAQQTARAAQLLLRDFRQGLHSLPQVEAMRHLVVWGLATADAAGF